MLGRTGDYLNASLMAFAGAADFFAAIRPELGENVARYYRHVRDHDLVLTHTLVNPQVNRRLTATGTPSPEVALHVVDRSDRGVVVRGARLLATLGPLSDEIVVFPSTILKNDPSSGPFAIAFALPNATRGMRFLCRDSYDEGKSGFDAPLASRFEEMDAVVLFDDVLVPWDRVFLLDDVGACNEVFATTGAVVHMMHQVACKNLAKAEFIVGLLCAMTQASERDQLPQVQGMVAEAMWTAETMRALLRTAEAEAAPDRWGTTTPSRMPLDTARNLFPRLYPRLVELVQLLGSSSLMATPCEADFTGGLAADVERYFQLAHADARERVALFRLAHEVATSGFGARQVLYERFFFGPPELLAANFYRIYDKDPLVGRVREQIARAGGG
jgi:4-hydroxyphenylacetate 3-monooxygenase